MRKLGVPYLDGYEARANQDLERQADSIRTNLILDKFKTPHNKEILALIAYLQRLGKDIKSAPKQEVTKIQKYESVLGN